MRYPGGKFRCYQKLINLIPPHRVYIETHLGGGAVLRNKSPAELNIGIDRDPAVIRQFEGKFGANYQFFPRTAEEFLAGYHFKGDEFIYSDPPYLPRTRRSSRSPYRYVYSDAEHLELLRILRELPCRTMISGYGSALYDENLKGWRKYLFVGTSHVGRRRETVWMNFEPGIVHDTRFLGDTFRDRQTLRRKRARWAARFEGEPVAVQQALLGDLARAFRRRAGRGVQI